MIYFLPNYVYDGPFWPVTARSVCSARVVSAFVLTFHSFNLLCICANPQRWSLNIKLSLPLTRDLFAMVKGRFTLLG